MVKLRNMRSCIFIVMLQLPEEDPQNSPESLVAGYNLGQNKMEQEIRIPPNQGWSRAKCKTGYFAIYLWFWVSDSLFTDPLFSLQSPSSASLPHTSRTQVIKYKLQGRIYRPPAQGSLPMFLKRGKRKIKQRLCTERRGGGGGVRVYFSISFFKFIIILIWCCIYELNLKEEVYQRYFVVWSCLRHQSLLILENSFTYTYK